MSQVPPRERSPRILLVRLRGVPEVVHSLPILHGLRDHFPTAWLAWAVEEPAAELLLGLPDLDEVVVLSRGWNRSPTTVWRLRQRLRFTQFETTIDADGTLAGSLVARLSGAVQRIAPRRGGSTWLPWPGRGRRPPLDLRYRVDGGLELLRPLGIDSAQVRFGLVEDEPHAAAANWTLQEAGFHSGFALLHRGVGAMRAWPEATAAAVIRHLGHARALPTLILWGCEREREAAARITDHADGHARVAPRTTLRHVAALARRARLCLGGDEGPLYLAAAVGAPCVGLFGGRSGDGQAPGGVRRVLLEDGSARCFQPAQIIAACEESLACGGQLIGT